MAVGIAWLTYGGMYYNIGAGCVLWPSTYELEI